MYVMKMTLNLSGFPPQTPQPQSNHEKNSRQILIQRHSTKYLTSTSQNCQGQKQGMPEKCHSQEEPKETEPHVTPCGTGLGILEQEEDIR